MARHQVIAEIRNFISAYLAEILLARCVGCLDRAFDSAETTLASVLAKARFWDEHAEGKLGDRQRLIVSRLLNGFQGKLTSSKYAILAKCSQDTATRGGILGRRWRKAHSLHCQPRGA